MGFTLVKWSTQLQYLSHSNRICATLCPRDGGIWICEHIRSAAHSVLSHRLPWSSHHLLADWGWTKASA